MSEFFLRHGPELLVVAVLFLATFVRSTFGFGEALVGVPLLALLISVKIAAPLAVLASVTVALLITLQDWRDVHLQSAGWLILSTLFGIPVGLLLLRLASDALVKAVLATVILLFSAYSLRNRNPYELKHDRVAWVFGFVAGVLGGAYGMNGPPLVVYGALRGWSPVQFRATMQGYFLFASSLGLAGYWSLGLWTSTVNHYYLLSLPGVVLAVLLGRAANRRLGDQRFYRYLFAGLVVIAAGLLLQALRR